MAFLELHDAAIAYKSNDLVIDGLSLAVKEGELVSFLGPSGCGKTTTLRAIAGFVRLQRGRLLIGGQNYTSVPPNKRNIGMVFQSYALFPHLSVFDNVAFGLKLRGVPRDQLNEKVERALTMVGLTGFDKRLPAQLSGGQQQRVAMARAIVIEPQLLLLDEPLSNLDAKLRVELRAELKRVQRRLGVTMVYVTHDQVEALALSDRVVVMNAGNIEQLGSPEEIYQQPRTAFVAQFMGYSNRLTGLVQGTQDGYVHIRTAAGDIEAKAVGPVANKVLVAIRPSSIAILSADAPPPSHGSLVTGEIILRTFEGEMVNYFIKTPLGDLEVEVPAARAQWREGSNVQIALDRERCLAYAHY